MVSVLVVKAPGAAPSSAGASAPLSAGVVVVTGVAGVEVGGPYRGRHCGGRIPTGSDGQEKPAYGEGHDEAQREPVGPRPERRRPVAPGHARHAPARGSARLCLGHDGAPSVVNAQPAAIRRLGEIVGSDGDSLKRLPSAPAMDTMGLGVLSIPMQSSEVGHLKRRLVLSTILVASLLAFLTALNAALVELRADGVYQKICAKWDITGN